MLPNYGTKGGRREEQCSIACSQPEKVITSEISWSPWLPGWEPLADVEHTLPMGWEASQVVICFLDDFLFYSLS